MQNIADYHLCTSGHQRARKALAQTARRACHQDLAALKIDFLHEQFFYAP
jgi:hypothetical protein